MATYYIDPSAETNGDGSEGSPFNTLEGVTISGGDSYYFKRGTTYTPTGGTYAVSVGGSTVTIGAYGSGERPIIDCINMNRGVSITNDAANVTIDSLYIRNVGSGNSRRGIVNSTTGSSGTVVTNIKVSNCVITGVESDGANDCDAIQLYGSGIQILHTTISDIATDGVWILGQNAEIAHCRITHVSQDGRDQGDCIQMSGACAGFNIHHNTLDHSDKPAKQCFIINGVTDAGGGRFWQNNVKGHDDANHTSVYIDSPNVIVSGNKVEGGNVCVSFVSNATGAKAIGNVLINDYNRAIDAPRTNNVVTNNVIVSPAGTGVAGIRDSVAGSSGKVYQNNFVMGFATGIVVTAGSSESYNYFCKVATPVSGATISGTSTDDDTAYQYLNSDYSLRSIGYTLASPNPLATAGTYAKGLVLKNGRARSGWTPVGAYIGMVPRSIR